MAMQMNTEIAAPAFRLMGKKKELCKGGHNIQIILIADTSSIKVMVEYKCSECEIILHTHVISELPESIIKQKCLPKIIKEVK